MFSFYHKTQNWSICWYFKLTPKYVYYVVYSVQESLLIIDVIIMIFSLSASLFMNSVQLIIFPERVKVVVRYNWWIFCLYICLRRVDWLNIIVLKRNHKQWLSTKRTITAHILPQNTKKTTTYDVSNPDPDLGQTQKCGGV